MINYKKLIEDLTYKGVTKELWYDPKNYIQDTGSNSPLYQKSGFRERDILFQIRVPLSNQYVNLSIYADFIGTQAGYITIQPGNDINFEVNIDTSKEQVEYQLIYYYKQHLTLENDVALILKTYTAFDFINLSNHINVKPNDTNYINDKFRIAFSRVESDDAKLDWLYENAYPSAVKARGDEQLWTDMLRLSKYDGEKWFVDTGSAIKNIITGFSEDKSLINKVKKNQKIIMDVYNTISDYPTKQAFASLINGIAQIEGNDLYKPIFLEGKQYKIESEKSEKENKIFRIINKKNIGSSLAPSIGGGVSVPYDVYNTIETADLDPSDLVIIKNSDIKSSKKNPLPTLPSAAIMLYYIADNEAHEDLVKLMRLTLDIAAILSAAYSGGTVPLLIRTLEAGIAITDIAMMSDEVKEFLRENGFGWFVDNWDTIYLMIGMGFISSFIVKGIIARGPAIIEFSKNAKNVPKNWNIFKKDLELLVKEASAYEAKQAAKLIAEGGHEIEEVIIKSDKYGIWRKILNLTSSPEKYIEQIIKDLKSKNITLESIAENSYTISYKGLKIKEGNQSLIGVYLRSIHFSGGKKFFHIIMPWVNREVISNFTHKATSGAKLTGYEDLGTFLVGSFGSDLQYILKQMHYPELVDKTMLEAGYPFNIPKSQKFNLLNVSNDIYEEAIKRGGFFTQVNSKWVDAAVIQKVEVVILSEEKYLRSFDITSGKSVLTGFGKEIHRFEWKHNYRFNPKTKRMVPPHEGKGLKTLTKFDEYTIKK